MSEARGKTLPVYKTLLAPDIDREEEEDPDHINEVPVPSCSFKAKVVVGREVPLQRTHQTYEEEDRADDNVDAVKTRRHEEDAAIDRRLTIKIIGQTKAAWLYS